MDTQDIEPRFWRSPSGIGLLVVALVGGFFLLTEHTGRICLDGFRSFSSLLVH